MTCSDGTGTRPRTCETSDWEPRLNQDIADHARQHRLSIISIDQDFGNVLLFPPANYHGLVVIRPPKGATVPILLSLVEQFLNDSKVIANLSGRLVIVEPGRLRCRPPI